jgi:uncharacterized SAM-binding protein YcdF (DUF218 family)
MQHLESLLKEKEQNGSAIIILGGNNERFRKRLEKAIELYEQKSNSFLLIAGQNIHSDKITMKMLEDKDFVYENKSVNTYENAVNSFEMLRIIKANDPFGFANKDYCMGFSDVIVVTDTLHMPRAKRYFSKVFKNAYDISFVKVQEEKADLVNKMIYEGIGYFLSFLPDKYLNFAKYIKQKYFPCL